MDTLTLSAPEPLSPEPSSVAVQAELLMPHASVRIIRFDLEAEAFYASNALPDAYRLDLCLTPRPRGARVCFYERWGPLRYEPIGDIFLVPPNHKMNVRCERGTQASIVCLLDREMVERWAEFPLEWTDRRLEAGLDISNAHIRSLMLRLAEEAHRPRMGSAELAGLAAGQLAIELARFCAVIEDGPATGGLAAWRLRLIDERLRDLREAVTLGDLATICNLSVRQLTRGFRTSRGCSIKEYVAHRRIEEAKRLLAGGEGVKAIAFAVGFASPSAFAFAFRSATGSTPLQFRQRFLRARRGN
jgi:AraC family transcriptional regulator